MYETIINYECMIRKQIYIVQLFLCMTVYQCHRLSTPCRYVTNCRVMRELTGKEKKISSIMYYCCECSVPHYHKILSV